MGNARFTEVADSTTVRQPCAHYYGASAVENPDENCCVYLPNGGAPVMVPAYLADGLSLEELFSLAEQACCIPRVNDAHAASVYHF
jgi:hypothetical protein